MRHWHQFMPRFGIVVAFCLLIGGVMLAALPWAPELREAIFHVMLSDRLSLTLLGLGCFTIGAFLLSVFLKELHGETLHLRKGALELSVQTPLIQRYTHRFLEEHYPEEPCSCDVSATEEGVSIALRFPSEEQRFSEAELASIQEALQRLFAIQLGYRGALHLAVQTPGKPILV